MKERRPFKRVGGDSWIAGVCGGIAYAYGLPVIGVRIAFVLFVLVLSNTYFSYIGEFMFLAYILAWLLGPEWDRDPKDYVKRTS